MNCGSLSQVMWGAGVLLFTERFYPDVERLSLTSLTMGGNVMKIGKSAFANCKKLTKVTINVAGLKTIGTKVFYGGSKLKTVRTSSRKLRTVGKAAFKGSSRKATLAAPAKQRKAYKKLLVKKIIKGVVK